MQYLFLVQDPRGAGSRYRALQFLPALAAAGVKVVVEPVPPSGSRRRRLFRALAEYDLVFVQKKLFTCWQVRTLRRRSRSLVYDLDDAVMYRATGTGTPSSFTRRRRFSAIARAADLVIAGNEYLAEQARAYTDSVTIIPTALDPGRYDPRPSRKPSLGRLTLGWVGSKSTLLYLESLRPTLQRLATRFPDVELKVICDAFPEFPFMPTVRQVWGEETEALQIQSIDVGLAPLLEDPWSRGKCGLKILQYYAAGKPLVASPVGAQSQIVQEGVTGFHARDEAEWEERVAQLLADAELRVRMGAAGRERLEQRYSLDVAAPALIGALQRAAAGSRGG